MNRVSSHIACFAAIALSMAWAGSAHASIVVNGSFEAGTNLDATIATSIDGWIIGGNGVERFQPTPYGLGAAPDGDWVIDLAYVSTGNGIISQPLPTVAGSLYDLTLALGNSTFAGRTGAGVVDVFIDSIFAASLNTPTASGDTIEWAYYTLQFLALPGGSTIEFRNTQDSTTHFAFVDDVSVTAAVPEAAGLVTWSLLAASCVGLLAWRRR